jgi:chromosome segregation ATPase
MIETIMYFGIGFLCASLLGLVLVPLVHNRAARLTMRRMEAATPLSMAEIHADKDQLRAEFAMSTRRLEMSIEQLKARSTGQLSELGRKSDAIGRLKETLEEKTAAIMALETHQKALEDHIKALEDQLAAAGQELAAKTAAMRETERALADKETALGRRSTELDQSTMVADSQKVEIASLRIQLDGLKSQLDRAEKDVKDSDDRLARERSDADAATKELADERHKVENLGNRVAQLERQLVAQTTEAEILGRRAQDLEARLAEQGRVLAEREFTLNQLDGEIGAARKAEADTRAELVATDGRHRESADRMRADNVRLQAELAQMREERSKLQQELSATLRDAEASWASERSDNAVLRERVSDVAAEIARLTMALEGPNSPIESILAADATPTATNGANATDRGERTPGSLADRIRALQGRVSRPSPAS